MGGSRGAPAAAPCRCWGVRGREQHQCTGPSSLLTAVAAPLALRLPAELPGAPHTGGSSLAGFNPLGDLGGEGEGEQKAVMGVAWCAPLRSAGPCWAVLVVAADASALLCRLLHMAAAGACCSSICHHPHGPPAAPSCRAADSQEVVAHLVPAHSTAATLAASDMVTAASALPPPEDLAGLDLQALASADLPEHQPPQQAQQAQQGGGRRAGTGGGEAGGAAGPPSGESSGSGAGDLYVTPRETLGSPAPPPSARAT